MTSSLGFCKWVAFLLLVSSNLQHSVTGGGIGIGLLYGLNGDNLPPPHTVTGKFRQYEITNARLYSPDPKVLQALDDDSKETPARCISVYLGVPNEDLQSIAGDANAAVTWVKTHMDPYPNTCFDFITVGNEAIPGPYAKYVAPAIRNMRAAVEANGYGFVGVSTVVGTQVLGKTRAVASNAAFLDTILGDMVDVLKEIAISDGEVSVLQEVQRLMINIFPYSENLKDDLVSPAQMFNFTLIRYPPPGVMDGELAYQNMFDTLVDSFYWAMEKAGFKTVGVTVTETGWPWAGNGDLTTTDLASTYNGILMKRVVEGVGTPKRPDYPVQTFIKSIFDENKNGDGYNQHWGLWNTDLTPIYPVF